MDPVTTFFLMVKAVAEMITEIVRGQPESVRKAAWERWEQSLQRWDRLLDKFIPKDEVKK